MLFKFTKSKQNSRRKFIYEILTNSLIKRGQNEI